MGITTLPGCNIIIQSDVNDRTTDDVISWIHYLGKKNNIINYFGSHIIDDLKITFSNDTNIDLNNRPILKKWYRRGEFIIPKSNNFLVNIILFENYMPIKNFLDSPVFSSNINSYVDNDKFKLLTLHYCVKLGIKIPETLITTKIEIVNEFLKNKTKIITKAIENNTVFHSYNNYNFHYSPVLKVIQKEDFNFANYPSKFLPSLFQEYIEKEFEIRSFYLNGKFKSMAIFSQQNERTKEDFRNYDFERPNRNVPFQLPKNIEKRLHKLMVKIDINCGSFDIIYTPNGEYYFLEVNPIGQFQWLSHNCNYNIEKMIAKELND